MSRQRHVNDESVPEQGTGNGEQGTGNGREADASSPKRDEVWDTLVALYGEAPAGKNARGQWNRAAADLRAEGATPAELRKRHRFAMANDAWMAKRPIDLATNWAVIGTAIAEAQQPQQVGVYGGGPSPDEAREALDRVRKGTR